MSRIATASLLSLLCACNATVIDQTFVLGGEETLEHPGIVDVDGATGVLISDRVILTAGHVNGWSNECGPFGSIDVTREDGTRRSFGLAGGESLARHGELGENDLGVLYLLEPMSRDWATPLELAEDYPDADEMVTLYGHGYGGTWVDDGEGDPDPALVEAFGPKRRLTFRYGDGDQAGSPGDSGGPYLDAEGRVYAIHSGSARTRPGPSVFGDVIAHRDWIDARRDKPACTMHVPEVHQRGLEPIVEVRWRPTEFHASVEVQRAILGHTPIMFDSFGRPEITWQTIATDATPPVVDTDVDIGQRYIYRLLVETGGNVEPKPGPAMAVAVVESSCSAGLLRSSGGCEAAEAISLGGDQVCAVSSTGRVLCFGNGLPLATELLPGRRFSAVHYSGEESGTCGLDEDGTVHCWGRELTTMPRQVAAGVVSYEGGTCGLNAAGSLVCWHGSEATLPPDLPPLESVMVLGTMCNHDGSHTACLSRRRCALTRSGEVFCWLEGQTPEKKLENVTMYRFGAMSELYQLQNGQVWYRFRDNVQRVEVPGTVAELNISMWDRACVRNTEGKAWCFDPSFDELELEPVDGRFRAIGTTIANACGIDPSGRVLCWGTRNGRGELGNGGIWARRYVRDFIARH